MKRLLRFFILGLVLLFTLTACGSKVVFKDFEDFKTRYNAMADKLKYENKIESFSMEEMRRNTDDDYDGDTYTCKLTNDDISLEFIDYISDKEKEIIVINGLFFMEEENIIDTIYTAMLACDEKLKENENLKEEIKDYLQENITDEIKDVKNDIIIADSIECDKFSYAAYYNHSYLEFRLCVGDGFEKQKETEEPTEYEFISGIYTVDEDIPKGKYDDGFVITVEEFKNLYNNTAKILEIDEIDDFLYIELNSSELYSCKLGNYETYLNLIKIKDEDNFSDISLYTKEFDTEEKLQEFLMFSFGIALTCDPTIIKIDDVKDKFAKGIMNAVKNEEEAQFIKSDEFNYAYMYSGNKLAFFVS